MKSLPTTQTNDLLNFLAPRPFNEVAAFMNVLSGALQEAGEEAKNIKLDEEALNGLLNYLTQLPYAQVSEGIQWVTAALEQQAPKTPKARKKK